MSVEAAEIPMRTENYYGTFFEGGAVDSLKKSVTDTIQKLKGSGEWDAKWDSVVANMDDLVSRKVGLDHVTFAHCNDIAPEGSDRLDVIRDRARILSALQPKFKVVGVAISEKVMALHMAISFPDWDPGERPLTDSEKLLMAEVNKKAFPHVTISLNGASAVESNFLLEKLLLNGSAARVDIEKQDEKYGHMRYIPFDDGVTVQGTILQKEYQVKA